MSGKNNAAWVAIVVAVIAAGAGFWGGMAYAGSRAPVRGQFAQGVGAAGGQFAGRTGGAGAGRFGGNGANAVFGTIIAKDETSITVKLGGPGATSTNGANTGSRIVLVNGSTQVMKTVAGSTGDLSIGESVVANGSPNSDGSITATMVQLRPAGAGAQR